MYIKEQLNHTIINTTQFETICKYILDVQGYVGTKSQTITSCKREMDEHRNRYDEAIKNGNEKEAEDIIEKFKDEAEMEISRDSSQDDYDENQLTLDI